MVKRFEFQGTGGALFGKFFIGMILTMITFGIYYPWFLVSLNKYIYENSTLKTDGGDVRFEFVGNGGQLFGIWIIGAILTMITLGIYGPWFMVNVTKYFWENSRGKAADGTIYTLRFDGNGGDLFITIFVGYVLTFITIGIYGAWFVCNLNKYFAVNTTILEGSNPVGKADFTGTGGQLLGTWIVGMILTFITFGIYGAWFAVKLFKFFYGNTKVTINNENYVGGFSGTGGEYFIINFVGYILTAITFGIYGAWYACNLIKYQLENMTIQEST
jgi:uncharacterized membrane protein YjgN (DUF898 family)